MNQSPFQSPEADLPLISRKRRLGHENGNEAIRNTPSAPVPVSQNFTVQEIIEQDRAYFASRNDRPPYVKELSVQRQFTAVLADQDKRRSEHQIVAHARDWGGGFQYWIVNLDGQERIVDKVRGGQGGYRLRLWLGHQEYERGIEGEIVGFAPLPPKDDINGQVITRSEDGSGSSTEFPVFYSTLTSSFQSHRMYDSIPCRPESESKHVIRNHQPDEVRITVHERPRRLWHVPMPLSKVDRLLKPVRQKPTSQRQRNHGLQRLAISHSRINSGSYSHRRRQRTLWEFR